MRSRLAVVAFLGCGLAVGTTVVANAGIVNYEYDALGRLTKSSYARGSLKTNVNVQYKFDTRGNRTEKSVGTSAGPGGGSSNHAPVAVTDNLVLTLVGSEGGYSAYMTCVSPLLNDTDADNDALSITSGWETDENGCFLVVVPDNEGYSDAVSYTISDGQGGTANGTINVSI